MKLILNGGGIGDKVKDARNLLNEIIDNNKKNYIFHLHGQMVHIKVA